MSPNKKRQKNDNVHDSIIQGEYNLGYALYYDRTWSENKLG